MEAKNIMLCVWCVTVCVLLVPAAIAAPRTTPVTVENTPSVSIFNVPTVRFDPTGNTVKAEQSGTWSVGISTSANTVKAPTQSQMFQCWSTDQVVPDAGSVTWHSPDLSGYKEARALLFANSALPSLKLSVAFVGPVSTNSVGWCTFYPGSVGIITQANFAPINYQCAFTTPLMSDRLVLTVQNNTGGPVTISRLGWVYVVN